MIIWSSESRSCKKWCEFDSLWCLHARLLFTVYVLDCNIGTSDNIPCKLDLDISYFRVNDAEAKVVITADEAVRGQ